METRQDEALSTGCTDAMVSGSVYLYDGLEETNRDILAKSSSAPDDPMLHRCIVSEQVCQQRCNDYVTWRAPDELTP
jgi:hypothetical protein